MGGESSIRKLNTLSSKKVKWIFLCWIFKFIKSGGRARWTHGDGSTALHVAHRAICTAFHDQQFPSTATNARSFEEMTNKEWIETGMKWPQIFERLVLGCIDSYDSEKRRIWQNFSRSTRCAFLCTFGICHVKKPLGKTTQKPSEKSETTRPQRKGRNWSKISPTWKIQRILVTNLIDSILFFIYFQENRQNLAVFVAILAEIQNLDHFFLEFHRLSRKCCQIPII